MSVRRVLDNWRWNYNASGETISKFRAAEFNSNLPELKKTIVVVMEEIKTAINDGRATRRLNTLIKKWTEVEEDTKSCQRLLDKFYDFCDEYGVFINLV